MSGFLELQYMPVLKCNVIITWDENFSYPHRTKLQESVNGNVAETC